jgi:glucan 1,3-beta-glucosidase
MLKTIRAGQVPIYGVNLGGWLVVEHWINSDDALWNGVPDTVKTNKINLMRFKIK